MLKITRMKPMYWSTSQSHSTCQCQALSNLLTHILALSLSRSHREQWRSPHQLFQRHFTELLALLLPWNQIYWLTSSWCHYLLIHHFLMLMDLWVCHMNLSGPCHLCLDLFIGFLSQDPNIHVFILNPDRTSGKYVTTNLKGKGNGKCKWEEKKLSLFCIIIQFNHDYSRVPIIYLCLIRFDS